jgi:hypothetical protein
VAPGGVGGGPSGGGAGAAVGVVAGAGGGAAGRGVMMPPPGVVGGAGVALAEAVESPSGRKRETLCASRWRSASPAGASGRCGGME